MRHVSCCDLSETRYLTFWIRSNDEKLQRYGMRHAAPVHEEIPAGSRPRSGSVPAPGGSLAAAGKPEKENLKFGFIKLTDMAPLAIAYEKDYFEDEGLYVTLEPQANWKVLLDRVIDGELDGAHMLAGQPLGATVGFGTKANVITAFSMDLNGNGVTVSNDVWEADEKADTAGERQAGAPDQGGLPQAGDRAMRSRRQALQDGHGLPGLHPQLRTALLARGRRHTSGLLRPAKGDITGQIGAEVLLSVTPPPQMPATLEAGTIDGYCVGEPWNQQAVFKGIGVPVITDYEIWKDNPEKVFGVSKAWADKYPNTHKAVLKALIRAASGWTRAALRTARRPRRSCRVPSMSARTTR